MNHNRRKCQFRRCRVCNGFDDLAVPFIPGIEKLNVGEEGLNTISVVIDKLTTSAHFIPTL